MLLLYILPLLLSTGFGLVLAFAVARNRAVPGSRALVALLLAASLWSLGYALEIASPGLNAKLFWAKFQYFGITVLPVAWFMFSVQYLGTPTWLPPLRYMRLLLSAIPALTLLLVWTNELHLLIWQSEQPVQMGPLWLLELEHGPWFWVFWGYSYLLLLLGSIWLVRCSLSSNNLLRWQVWLVIAGACIPWLGNLLYATRLNPIQDIDWTPFGFIVAGLLFSLSYFRFRMVKVVPIAHRVVFEGLNDSILVLDADDRVIDMNLAAQKMIQIPYAKLAGTPLAQVLPDLDEKIRNTGSNQVSSKEIMLGCTPDEPYYELHVTPLTGRSAELVGRLVVLHDITQRKQEQMRLEQARLQLEEVVAERTKELRQAVLQLQYELTQRSLAERRFEDIVDSAPDTILLINEHGKILLANAQAELAFGYLKNEFIGKEISDLIPERLHIQLNQFVPQFLADPTRHQIDPQQDPSCRRADGSEFPVEIHLSPLKTSEGILVACTIRDISRRRKAEQALQESERTYRTLFEGASDAIFLIGLKGEILQANQKAVDFLGYTQEELQRLVVKDIIARGEYPDFVHKRDKLLSGQTLQIYERKIRNKAGEIVPVEVNMVLLRDRDGAPRCLQSILRDITERKKAEQEEMRLLEEIQQSREQLRLLAHRLQEVRELERRQIAAELHDRVGQNLTALNLNLTSIHNRLSSESDGSIHRRLDDSLELVEETTRYVRDVMTELHPPMLDEFGLVSALHWYCDNFSQVTALHTQVVGDEFEPRLPRAAETILFRIAQEALTNVAKYAQATRVVVRVEACSNIASLSVEDDGLGFDPEAIKFAPELPHWGLIIMRERAASAGGELKVQSMPGEGTRVSVTMRRPLYED